MAKNESLTVFTSEYAAGVINNAQLLILDLTTPITPHQREYLASALSDLLNGIYRREYDQTLIDELALATKERNVEKLESLLSK